MKRKRILQALLFALLVPALLAGPAAGAEFWLRADATTKTMPDGAVVPMWGFGLDADNNFATVDATITVPGPALTVPVGDNQLIIHVQNALPEAISLVVPGLPKPPNPTTFTDGQGRQRMRAFTLEVAPGGTGVYQYNTVRPGTYIYQSGSHVAAQIPMGLYGVLKHDAAAGQIYASPATAYAKEAVLVYSEVDPALNNAISTGAFGTPAHPSNIDYAPKYFLLNGDPNATVGAVAVAAGQQVLLRFANAGIVTRVPLLKDYYMTLVAEAGYPYTYPKTQYEMTLEAGKTKDAILTAANANPLLITDRRGWVSKGSIGAAALLAADGTAKPVVGPVTAASAAAASSAPAKSSGSCFLQTLLGL